jgi:hypothetical protein
MLSNFHRIVAATNLRPNTQRVSSWTTRHAQSAAHMKYAIVKRYSWREENQQPRLYINQLQQEVGLIHFTYQSPRYLKAINLPVAVEDTALSPIMQTSNTWHTHISVIMAGLT